MRRLDSLLRPGRVVAICEQNWNTEEYTVVLENVSGDGVEDRLDRREIRCTGMYEQESPQEMTWAWTKARAMGTEWKQNQQDNTKRTTHEY